MTEEEIRKLADHYISEKFPLNHSWEKGDEHRAFIAGAHSRDEEIEKWKNLCDRLTIEKWQLQEKLHNLDN